MAIREVKSKVHERQREGEREERVMRQRERGRGGGKRVNERKKAKMTDI